MRHLAELALVAVFGAGIVSVGIALSQLTWHALGHVDIDTPRQAGPSPQTAVDLGPILNLAPFGSAPEPTASTVSASVTDHVLRGVVMAKPASSSLAVISSNGADARAYAVGQSLTGGARLEEVRVDSVILDTDGNRVLLTFPDLKAVTSNATGGVVGLAAAARTGSGSNATQASSREVIDGYRRKIADNPKSVLDELGFAQADQGYVVAETPAASVLRAGLKPGDRVVRVNGAEIGQIEADRRLFEEVVASGRARVEIQRGAQRVVLSFPLD